MADWQEQLDALIKIYPDLKYVESDSAILLPSICHHKDINHTDKNLRLYKSSGLFHCFSQCQSTFNFNQLIKKREKLEEREILAPKITSARTNFNTELYTDTLSRIQAHNAAKNQKTISANLLQSYGVADELNPWYIEGIDIEILKKFNVGFSKTDNAVIIPHFDIDGHLIGIRRRSYNQNENKYMPWSWNGKMYASALGLNLYGANINKPYIQQGNILYIAEGEKSVLQGWVFGLRNVVATCGFGISQTQISLIQKYLKPDIVVVAYDKEYYSAATQAEYFITVQKKFKTLALYTDVYVLIDTDNLFGLKQSPFDLTIEDFNALDKWKI